MAKGSFEAETDTPQPLVILESPQAIRPTTNPYIVQLIEALRANSDVEVELFSFRRAIFGSYDVFHVHWPETLFTANSALKRWRRRILVLIFVCRLLLAHKPVVRTWHNLERPSELGRFDTLLLDLMDRATTIRIALNPLSTFPDDKPAVVIPHGHYRDWYRTGVSSAVPGRVGYVGLIRRYKGVETLVSAFTSLDSAATLHIAGNPSSPELSEHLRSLAGDDARISFDFRFLDDVDFTTAITASSLIVLPYHHMHNSGTALAALSLARPVLVPDNPTNRLLADEVGAGWMHFFTGKLTSAALERAIHAVTTEPPQQDPDLSQREWSSAGTSHLEVFREAILLTRQR